MMEEELEKLKTITKEIEEKKEFKEIMTLYKEGRKTSEKAKRNINKALAEVEEELI